MTRCRACKSERLHLFLPLGPHPLANGFLTAEQLSETEPTFALDAHVCLDCGLIQVRDNVPSDFFRNYVYVPSTSDAMRAHFDAFAAMVAADLLSGPEALAVDIGCNDGLFLKGLRARGARCLGVDPATNIIEMARRHDLEIVNEYFTPPVARRIREEYGPAALIVTTNTFHHVDDLDSFTEGVRELLGDDGIFLIEVPHALELVERNEFDGIYHEHVSQFTVKSFVDLFRRFDLEVFRIDRLEVHGGSIRVFVRRGSAGGAGEPDIAAWVARETERGLFDVATYDELARRVTRIRGALLDLLRERRGAGRRIIGYGASARGNTLLNYYGIGRELLDCIVDRNELKQGLYSPGMHIPVHGVDRILDDRPDDILVLAWNFADEIIEQQAEFARLGGTFIIPLPEPRVIAPDGGSDGGAGESPSSPPGAAP